MTRFQAIERLMVAAGCVYSLFFVAMFAGCVSAIRSCPAPTVEVRLPPNAFTWPFEVLCWLTRFVVKAMYPFLFDESR